MVKRVFILAYFIGLRASTEYGMGVTAVKDERESLPTTTNAVTGKTQITMTTQSHTINNQAMQQSKEKVLILTSKVKFLKRND